VVCGLSSVVRSDGNEDEDGDEDEDEDEDGGEGPEGLV
jgi:hypothetical protein